MAKVEQSGAPWPGAVGVSGGGDSLALMFLLARWAREHGRRAPVVLTVDHGLRKDSAKDTQRVIRAAKALNLEAHILKWKGSKPASDIEAAAREARYQLMGSWCVERGVSGLYLAHTLEDQAETFLLRLARGSGIDGLSAMKDVSSLPLSRYAEVALVRPLLGMHREHLRNYLRAYGQEWTDDPMNIDPRFARAKLRAAWPALEAVGLTPPRIVLAARHLGRARETLDQETNALLQRIGLVYEHSMVVDARSLAAAPREIGLRALTDVLMRVSGNPYRPRFERLERLYEYICASGISGGMTLHGCRVSPAQKESAVFGPGTLLVSPEKPRRPQKTGTRARLAR